MAYGFRHGVSGGGASPSEPTFKEFINIGVGRSISNSSYDYYIISSYGISDSNQSNANSYGTSRISGGTLIGSYGAGTAKTGDRYSYMSCKLYKRDPNSTLTCTCSSSNGMMIVVAVVI